MIALLPSPDSLDDVVARAGAAAHNAAAIWLDAVVTHIHELADQAEAMRAEVRDHAADVPGSPDRYESLGEGGELLEVVTLVALEAHRYAQEAVYWLDAYRAAQARMAEGKPALSWDYDQDLEPERLQIAYTREFMREAAGYRAPRPLAVPLTAQKGQEA